MIALITQDQESTKIRMQHVTLPRLSPSFRIRHPSIPSKVQPFPSFDVHKYSRNRLYHISHLINHHRLIPITTSLGPKPTSTSSNNHASHPSPISQKTHLFSHQHLHSHLNQKTPITMHPQAHDACPKCGAGISGGKTCGSCGSVSLIPPLSVNLPIYVTSGVGRSGG